MKEPAKFICSLVLLVFSLLLAGCTTTTHYQSFDNSSRTPRSDEYPIPIYTENMTVPRPCMVIGTLTISDDFFTVFGGDINKEMKEVQHQAHEKGADAIQIKKIQEPGYTDSNYRLTADFIAYSDNWESINLSAADFAAYLKANQQTLDPIEGVWDGRGVVPHYIGIKRDISKPGRDFVGFILGSSNPAWHPGYKKMDIRRGSQPGTYIIDYYLNNFAEQEATVLLGAKGVFTLLVQKSDSDSRVDDVMYFKNW